MEAAAASIQTCFDEAVRLYDEGRFAEATAKYGDVLALFIAHEIDDYVFLINVYVGMGASKHMANDEEGALDAYCKALAVAEMLYGRGSEAGLPILLNKALSHILLNHPVEALNELGKARAMVGKIKQCSERETFLAAVMHNTAVAYMALKRPKDAIQEYKAALRLEERIHGREHSEYARSLFGIGEAYAAAGAVNLALESFLEADKIRTSLGCSSRVELGRTKLAITQLYISRNEVKKATRYAQDALMLLEPDGTRSQSDPRALRAVRSIMRFIGDHEQAAKQRRIKDGEYA